MRVWRLLGAGLAVPVMLGGLVLVTAGPAAACSCLQRSEAQHAARVDAVFVGRLVGRRVDPSVLSREYREAKRKEQAQRSALALRKSDPVVLTFEVSRVYKGAVGERQEIVIPPGAADHGGSCGFYVPEGRGPWVIFASQSSGDSFQLGQYVSSFMTVCSGGSRALADGGEPALANSVCGFW